MFLYNLSFFIACCLLSLSIFSVVSSDVKSCLSLDKVHSTDFLTLSKTVIPSWEGKIKGDAGKIAIVGGSIEYTGAPYFAAISAFRVGADLVYVITTQDAAPVIKSYSPDLIVYPFLNVKDAGKINNLLSKMDVIVIGPGLGREEETLKLTYDIIETCKRMHKPLVVDADGLYAISQNLTVLKNYPAPGAILTPNIREATKFKEELADENDWSGYWGEYVSVLIKGKEDEYRSSVPSLSWSIAEGGSPRRVGGQGDILSGSLGTFYNWALKSLSCANNDSPKLAQSIATYAAAKFTRSCSAHTFVKLGRSMIASDMLGNIHSAFDDIFS